MKSQVERDGIVFVIDGAGSSGFTPLVLRRMLSGSCLEVMHFKWGAGYMRVIADITNRERIAAKSSELARLILESGKTNGGRRIYIIAKSAGTGIALNALRELPDNFVEATILMSPAVSPGYPLEEALKAVRTEMVSFWSPMDLFWLGLGTGMFGTADGIKCKSAGLVGFLLPDANLAERMQAWQSQESKFRQIKWEPSMLLQGHFGGHAGNSMPPFLAKYILPIVINRPAHKS